MFRRTQVASDSLATDRQFFLTSADCLDSRLLQVFLTTFTHVNKHAGNDGTIAGRAGSERARTAGRMDGRAEATPSASECARAAQNSRAPTPADPAVRASGHVGN